MDRARHYDRIRRQSTISLSPDGEWIYVRAPYDAEMVKQVRGIEGRLWNGAANIFPVDQVGAVRAVAERFEIAVPQAILDLPIMSAGRSVSLEGDMLCIRFPDRNDIINDFRDSVPLATYRRRKAGGFWMAPMVNLGAVIEFANRHGLTVNDELGLLYAQRQVEVEDTFAASNAVDGNITFPSLSIDFLPWQPIAVDYILRTRRVIVGDPVGCGKTLEALAAVVVADALPAIVVCKKTLRLNWVGEAKKFFPDMTTTLVSGTSPSAAEPADLVVTNYDIIASRAQDLIDLKPKTLICDESHRIKNGRARHCCPKCGSKVKINAKRCPECNTYPIEPVEEWTVQRTGGVIQVARAIPDDGLRILLSGTMVTRSPADLIPQLQAIGRLEELFGSRWKFEKRYIGAGGSAINMGELNRTLREHCYLRRKKPNSPDPIIARQWLDIPKDVMAEYREAEDDVVHFIANRARELAEEAGEDGDEAYWEKKLRIEAVEHLIRFNALRTLIAKIKVPYVIDWFDAFFEDNDDEPMIAFGFHKALVDGVDDHYGDTSVKVSGAVTNEQARRDANTRFQDDPTCKMFVGQWESAGEGLTLHRAANGAMMELPWTPDVITQCLGRYHDRAGNRHQGTLWNLVVPGTVEDEMAEILEERAKFTTAIIDGEDAAASSKSIIGDLLVRIAKREGVG